MNFWIEPFLYTSPLARVMDVLNGSARKAAVFVGRDEVEGSVSIMLLILHEEPDT